MALPPGAEVEIVDREDRMVAANTVGLVRLKTPCMLQGYANSTIDDNSNFRDGWFYPGDIGRLASDGQLVHLGRSELLSLFQAQANGRFAASRVSSHKA